MFIISYLDGVGIGNGFVGTKDLILKSSGRDLSEESVLFVWLAGCCIGDNMAISPENIWKIF